MSPKITLVPSKTSPILTNNSVESESFNQVGTVKKLLITKPIDKLKITASKFHFFRKALPAKIKAMVVREKTMGKPFAVALALLPRVAAAKMAMA